MSEYERAASEAWELHCQGMAPSQIAKELGVEADTARRMVAEHWARDKALHQIREGLEKL